MKKREDVVATLDSGLKVRLSRDQIDLWIEKEHFSTKKKLCSVVKCHLKKTCPFYRDPESYERDLRKVKERIIIPPLIWMGTHYKWKECVDNNLECDYKRPECTMCDALTHCSYWSDHPYILEELGKITDRKIVKTTEVKRTTDTKRSKTAVTPTMKKDLQEQLISIDKTLKEISERWRILT